MRSHAVARRLASLGCAVLAALAPSGAPAAAPTFKYSSADVAAAFQRARAAVASAWAYDPAVVCASAGVHGHVEKRASGRDLAGLYKRGTSVSPTLPDIAAGVPVLSGVQVFISDKYKFIYIRQAKSSSSSIMAALGRMYCEGGEQRACGPHELTRLRSVDIDDGVWASYFVFTAVRNPIARMLSGYNMFRDILRRRVPGSTAPGDFCIPPFPACARSVVLLRSVCDTEQCCSFVKGGGGKYQNEFVEPFVNAHVSQQSHSIFTPDGDPVVDFIARTERMDEDWREITEQIARRSGEEVPFQPMGAENVRTLPPGGHRALAAVTGGVAGALRAGGGRGLRQELPSCWRPGMEVYLNESTVTDLALQFAMDMQLLGFLQHEEAKKSWSWFG